MEEKVKKEAFTKVPTAMLEKLARVKLSQNEFRTVMALIRKTFGWHKEKDRISLSQFQLATDLERKRQVEALKSLARKRIILRERGSTNSYALNKEYFEWLVAEQPPARAPEETAKLVALRAKLVASSELLLVAGPPHTIDITKDIITKPLIGDVVQSFDLGTHTLLTDVRCERVGTFTDNPPLTEARYEKVLPGDNTVSALPVPADVEIKKWRSIQEIRREHPGATRRLSDINGGGWKAAWFESDGAYKTERCL